MSRLIVLIVLQTLPVVPDGLENGLVAPRLCEVGIRLIALRLRGGLTSPAYGDGLVGLARYLSVILVPRRVARWDVSGWRGNRRHAW